MVEVVKSISNPVSTIFTFGPRFFLIFSSFIFSTISSFSSDVIAGSVSSFFVFSSSSITISIFVSVVLSGDFSAIILSISLEILAISSSSISSSGVTEMTLVVSPTIFEGTRMVSLVEFTNLSGSLITTVFFCFLIPGSPIAMTVSLFAGDFCNTITLNGAR